MPLAAVTGKAEIMDQPGPGAVGGTFGGNPVSCAAGLATLRLIEDGNLCARSQEIGKIFTKRAKQWQEKYECIGDIRGLGGMQAIELVLDREEKTPATELTKKVTRYALEHGLLLVTSGTYGNVIRLLVPLVATDEQMHEGMDILEKAFEALACEEVRECLTSAK
jgi:4-aminobutyrate aminotransferase/(S)-3-amino-2-methylpropionate transaminase